RATPGIRRRSGIRWRASSARRALLTDAPASAKTEAPEEPEPPLRAHQRPAAKARASANPAPQAPGDLGPRGCKCSKPGFAQSRGATEPAGGDPTRPPPAAPRGQAAAA